MAEPADALGLRNAPSDYDGMPPVRWSEPWSRRTVTVLTVIGALLVGFLLSAGLRAGRSAALEQDERRAELVELIEARQIHAEALSGQLEQLRAEVTAAEARASQGVPALRELVRRLETAAGLTRLRGPGLRVTLGDAEAPCATGRAEDCRIQDTDLQLAVNALFGAGAEAVAVNGERIIATTAIRSAGRSVLVNYRVLASPYVIEAIGNPEGLRARFAEAEVARDFAVWKDVYGLVFSAEQADELVLPAYNGSLRLRAASVAGDAA